MRTTHPSNRFSPWSKGWQHVTARTDDWMSSFHRNEIVSLLPPIALRSVS